MQLRILTKDRVHFSLHTIISLNRGNNQRFCNALIELIGCFFSGEHSICQHGYLNGYYTKNCQVAIKFNVQLEKVSFMTFVAPLKAKELTKTKTL